MQICADGPSRKAWTCYLGVMIILQHERRGGCCWTIPFIYSTASSRFIGIATTEKVGAHILTHNLRRCSHTSSLFFCISGQGQSRYSYSLIHILNNCSNVRNFRERQQQHNIVMAVHSRQMVEAGQKLHNKILSGYFMNAEPFFSGFWIDTNIYSPRALIS
jgi:hypothetical protein